MVADDSRFAFCRAGRAEDRGDECAQLGNRYAVRRRIGTHRPEDGIRPAVRRPEQFTQTIFLFKQARMDALTARLRGIRRHARGLQWHLFKTEKLLRGLPQKLMAGMLSTKHSFEELY